MRLTCASANGRERKHHEGKKRKTDKSNTKGEMHLAELMTTHVLTTTENNTKLCSKVAHLQGSRQFNIAQNKK